MPAAGKASEAAKADRPRGCIAWRCLLHGGFAFYAWADKPYLIAALRLGGTCWPDAAVYRYTRSLLGLRRLKPSRTLCTRWW